MNDVVKYVNADSEAAQLRIDNIISFYKICTVELEYFDEMQAEHDEIYFM
jgi:hypothetical protein